jgi:4a-hydroxytetrahydrobiopterin dehydratase
MYSLNYYKNILKGNSMPDKLSKDKIEESLKSLSGWSYADNSAGSGGGSIRKIYKTTAYPVTMGFVTAVGGICQRLNHHPDYIIMKFKEIEVSFSTHSAGGVTEKDIEAAKELEKIQF